MNLRELEWVLRVRREGEVLHINDGEKGRVE